jgi:hypothetical protein
MPYVEVRGKYRTFRYDGDSPLDFTTYNNLLCVVRRPNPTTFITLQQYVPGQGGQFTTFQPGSSYTIVSRFDGTQETYNFNIGPYTRVDRLPSSTFIKSPGFYIGLDKNSIVVPLSNYALSVNSPLSSVVGINYINGQGNRLQYVYADNFKTGAPLNFTHFLPNSGYELRNRIPFTFFAPLQNEMGDAYALGNNEGGEYGMGYRYSQTMAFWDRGGPPFVLSADQTFGLWDKIVFNSDSQQVTWNGQTFNAQSLAALSSCGTSKALFVLGSNLYGQLGTGSSLQYYPTWTRVAGQWKDIEMGAAHMVAISDSGYLYVCGNNASGQLGLGSGVASVNTLTLVDESVFPEQSTLAQIATLDYSTFIRDYNGFVFSCGDNESGQLGLNNLVSPVYILTREATNSAWASIKTSKTYDTLIALKNNTLYGCGGRNRIYGGGSISQQNILTREILNLGDITNFYTTGVGTFIQRQGQNYLFAAGENSTTYKLAALSSGTASYFTMTNIPSNMRNIISNYSSIAGTEYFNLGYIGSDFNVYIKSNDTNSFTQKTFKAFDAFSPAKSTDIYSQSPIFLLNNESNLRPTPTPTITPTKTPTPTPTPTQAYFPPFNDLSIAIYAAAWRQTNDTNGQQYLYSNTIANIDNAFTSEYINNNLTPPGHSMMLSLDYEKSDSFNNIVGTLCYPTYNKSRYLVKKIGTNWSFTLLDNSFDTGANYRPEYGTDSFFIAPPNVAEGRTNGVYKFTYLQNRSFIEATSYDRGSTWSKTTIETNLSPSSYNQGNSKKIYARTRNANYKIAFAGVYLGSGGTNTVLQYRESFPTLGTIENISPSGPTVPDVDKYTPWAIDFNYDYKNIPTVVSVDTKTPSNLRIHRKINDTWVSNIIITSLDLCYDTTYKVPDYTGVYYRYSSKCLSIDFDSTNPDLIYIAYLVNDRNIPTTGKSNAPAGISVCCYNMSTNTIIFNENVTSSVRRNTGLYKIGVYNDIPKIYYNTSNNSLYLLYYAVDYVTTSSRTAYYKQTKRTGTNSWSALTNFLPSRTESGASLSFTIANYWDVITKY